MKRFTEAMVFSGLVTALFLAALPTVRSPSLPKPTTEGVVRSPSALTRISGSGSTQVDADNFCHLAYSFQLRLLEEAPQANPLLLPI